VNNDLQLLELNHHLIDASRQVSNLVCSKTLSFWGWCC